MVSLLLVAAVLTGCGDDGEEAATTTTTRPRVTTTTDPFAVPDEIDAAYVQRVLTEHERVLGDATRTVITQRRVTTAAEERLRSIFAKQVADAELSSLRQRAERGFPNVQVPRGDRSVRVSKLSTVTKACVGVQARYGFQDVLVKPIPPADVVIELQPEPSNGDPVGYNPTGWIESFQYAAGQGEVPEPCGRR